MQLGVQTIITKLDRDYSCKFACPVPIRQLSLGSGGYSRQRHAPRFNDSCILNCSAGPHNTSQNAHIRLY